jgi:hypothetical protein
MHSRVDVHSRVSSFLQLNHRPAVAFEEASNRLLERTYRLAFRYRLHGLLAATENRRSGSQELLWHLAD